MSNLNAKYLYAETFLVAIFTAIVGIIFNLLFPKFPIISLIIGSGIGAVIGLFLSRTNIKFIRKILNSFLNSDQDKWGLINSFIIIIFLSSIVLFGFLTDIRIAVYIIGIIVFIVIGTIINNWDENNKKGSFDLPNQKEIERKKKYEASVRAQFKSEEEYQEWKRKLDKRNSIVNISSDNIPPINPKL